MLSEVSSTIRVSGALASRSRLVKGQRRDGSRKAMIDIMKPHSTQQKAIRLNEKKKLISGYPPGEKDFNKIEWLW